jgi:L-ascorbate peroxidase
MLRLAFSDAGTFDKNIREWPAMGGANGSIRFEGELSQSVNAGLSKAIALLQPVKTRNPTVSWADLIQMAGAKAVEIAGGPRIPMKYGRVDATIEKDHNRTKHSSMGICQAAKLPCANPPYPDGSHSAEFHIRNVFYRMGFSSREVVALCGAHTIGRAFKDRSGVCSYSSGDRGATRYTRPTAIAKPNNETGIGMAGGMSWTANWLHFDNSYYQRPLVRFCCLCA